ncbi:EF-hand calcium-binding domain-containing protein 4B [Xenopus tropicalis]|uniref:EF-hand calcium-binding domain-containing protein 4B n=2 Tax=Xenopus tropicalis TaxID=8364 RepID=A0A8J1J7X6_XENTR|nr:EF-hand calcium-binding domain-containing protein 4B [Xenopus tropicalis]
MASLTNTTPLRGDPQDHGNSTADGNPRGKMAEEQDTGQDGMLGKAHEFFQICDIEDKGFITRRDMQRLHGELPLSLDELEKVFDTLDADGNGYLTLEEFTTGFSQFLFGERIPTHTSAAEEPLEELEMDKEYEIKWEEGTHKLEDDENTHFYNLIDTLGANKFLEDENHIKKLWMELRKDEPHLLTSFEEFLIRIFSQLQEANAEKNEMECALKKKIANYDDEIQNLYEEMEQQIKTEKEQFLLQDTERYQSRSKDMEQRLQSKEHELDQLVHKQKRLEKQCKDLNNDKYETKAENEKLKTSNKEMRRELERTTQELVTAQGQLRILQEAASQLNEEREMEVYRVTESLQRERTALLRQLDLLREMNKHLRDERDSCLQKPKGNTGASIKSQRSDSIIGKYIERKPSVKSQSSEEEDVFHTKRNSFGLNGCFTSTQEPESVTDCKPNTPKQLQRIISIEEDHLPQLLDTQEERPLHEWKEVDESEETRVEVFESTEEQVPKGEVPSSPRGQPVGKETLATEERPYTAPERIFKIVLVGNSSVGKTSFLRRFCDGSFHPGTSATVGVDYSVKTVTVDNCQVALQLWDTAGQERYQEIQNVFERRWEATGENIPVMMLGNKTDIEKEREVPFGLGEHLAKDCNLIFYECSASSGHNVKKSVLHLARILKEQEDKVKEKTVRLLDSPKKRNCCSRQ